MTDSIDIKKLPAFPVTMTGPCEFSGIDVPQGATIEYGGMTLRDYFAAHAPPVPHDWRGGAKGFSSVIDWSWYYADNMLKERG